MQTCCIYAVTVAYITFQYEMSRLKIDTTLDHM